jgi:PAS domain S-box-containing protein
MRDQDKTKDELIAELVAMRQQVASLESSVLQHKQTEEALQESQEYFHLLVENVQDYAIFLLDTDGRIISWNVGGERILGYESAEIIGQLGSCIFTPEDLREGEDKKELRTAATEGRAFDERWHVRKDGTRFWASGVVTALRDEAGTLRGFAKVMRDFTERQRSESELRTRVQQHAVIAELGQHALAGTDLSALMDEAVSLVAKTLEVEYCKVLELLPSGDALLLRAGVGWREGLVGHATVGALTNSHAGYTLLSNKPVLVEDLHTETRFSIPKLLYDHGIISAVSVIIQGQYRPFGVLTACTTSLQTFTQEDIHFLQAVGNILAEAIERQRAESALREAACIEQQHATQLRELTKASLVINSDLSLDAMLQTITQQARDIIGAHQSITSLTINQNWAQAINAVSFSDKYAAWREYNEQFDRSGIYALTCRINQSIRMKQAELEAHFAWHGFEKSASKHPPMRGWLAVPLRGRDGRNLGLIQLSDKYEGEFTEDDEAIIVQLAQMASVAVENAQLYSAAQEANRMKDEFLAIVSHELRSPLNAMLGWAQLLRNRKFNEATKVRALETIERNAKSQLQLIEDLLDVSRIIRGQLRLTVRPVELIPVISAALDTVRAAAEAKAIQLEIELDPLAGLVSGDPDRLQQVVWNLLSNAVKFTPRGGRVQIRLSRVDSCVEIAVSDTGIGISADFLPYVFERFRQADSTSTRSYSGLGLGLAIVRHLVELQGGTVHATSEGEGQGATFTVKLPLMAVSLQSSSAAAPKAEGGTLLENSLMLKGLRVLVVDDEADARELLTTVLEEYGASVTKVASVGEALEALERLSLDVLVSDIGMPGEDGYELICKVRTLSVRGGQIPAVALTAYARDEERTRSLAAGFQVHMSKPVEPAQLATVIANLAGRT